MAKINLVDFRERRRNEGALTIELPDGDIVLDPPELWSQAARDAATTGDHDKFLRHLFGDTDYQRFVDAGGNYMLLNLMWVEAQGVNVGESAAS